MKYIFNEIKGRKIVSKEENTQIPEKKMNNKTTSFGLFATKIADKILLYFILQRFENEYKHMMLKRLKIFAKFAGFKGISTSEHYTSRKKQFIFILVVVTKFGYKKKNLSEVIANQMRNEKVKAKGIFISSRREFRANQRISMIHAVV